MTDPGPPRRQSPRWSCWDYSTPGAYFVMTNTRHFRRRFGRVVAGEMLENQAGQLVRNEWVQTLNAFPMVTCGTFVIMPDHFHAIVFVDQHDGAPKPIVVGLMDRFKSRTTVAYIRGVHAGRYPPLNRQLWHRSFYDRVIGNERELGILWEYIESNPLRWELKQKG